jgi:hypothetical protein
VIKLIPWCFRCNRVRKFEPWCSVCGSQLFMRRARPSKLESKAALELHKPHIMEKS